MNHEFTMLMFKTYSYFSPKFLPEESLEFTPLPLKLKNRFILLLIGDYHDEYLYTFYS